MFSKNSIFFIANLKHAVEDRYNSWGDGTSCSTFTHGAAAVTAATLTLTTSAQFQLYNLLAISLVTR